MKVGTFKEYRGIEGTIEISKKNNNHRGKLIVHDEYIAYEADTLEELYEEFHRAVDDYLDIKKGV